MKNWTEKLKPLLRKYSILEDIIFFGSFVKEKATPKDIDIALLVIKKDDKTIGHITKEISRVIESTKLDFAVISIKEIYSNIWITLLKEGYSVKKEEYLNNIYNIKPVILYKYSIKSLNPVQKVQFDRGLNRVLKEIDGKRLVRTVVIVPLQKAEEFEDFLKTWKMEYETRRYELLPELVATQRIL